MSGAGKRNKLITLEQLGQTVSDEGEAIEGVDTSVAVWGGIEPLTARERWVADNNQATTTHMISILYRSDVSTRWRAVWNNRIFNFDSVVNLEEKDNELQIRATEVTEGN